MTKKTLYKLFRNISTLSVIIGLLLGGPVPAALADEMSASTDTNMLVVAETSQVPIEAVSATSTEASADNTAQTSSSSDPITTHLGNEASSTDVASSTAPSDLNTTLPPSAHCGSSTSKVVATSTEVEAEASGTPSTISATSSEQAPLIPDCSILQTSASSTDDLSSRTVSTNVDVFTPSDIQSSQSASSGPIILSGRAVAEANILNIANTDIVNSDGNIIFSNLIDSKPGAIDLRSVSTTSTSTCSLSSCLGNSDIEIHATRDAHIANVIELNADTGNNAIVSEGDAVIQTGDAFAALNLVNIANVNLVGSQYLIVALNAFKGVEGDIIFPNLDKFFNAGSLSASSLTLANSGDIKNDVALTADAGNNEVTAASSTISTGVAQATSNIYNQINSTLGASDMVSILFNVHGTWNGKLVNAPLGLMNSRTADGSYFFSSASLPATLPFGGFATDSGSLDISGTSSALIENSVNIDALSGNNSISSTGSGSINSGKAFAGANIINIANVSVIGKNWLLAIVNIFGDFSGDITFGRPDLWVGDRVESAPPFINGNELTYRFTVINKGDAPSSKVRLMDTLDNTHLDIVRASLPYHVNKSGELEWELGDLPQGAATELTLTVRIKNGLAEGTSIENRVMVHGVEAESITENNTDVNIIKTDVIPAQGGSSGGGTIILIAPHGTGGNANTSGSVTTSTQAASSTTTSVTVPIDITRSTATTTLNDVDVKSSQNIIIRNPNNEKITAVTFHDILRDPSGAILKNEVWELGTLLPHEEITIGYDISFSKSATSGVYILGSMISRPHMSDMLYDANGSIILSKKEIAHSVRGTLNKSGHQLAIKVTSDTRDRGHGIESALGGILPETAYAASNDSELVQNNGGHKGGLLLLFLMPMILTMLFISMRSHKIKQ